MDPILASGLTTQTRKKSPNLIPRKQNLCSFSNQNNIKKQNYVFPMKQTKLQSLCAVSREKELKLRKIKSKMTLDQNKTPYDQIQKDVRKHSSIIRKGPLKNQIKAEGKSNKYLLSILLSHLSNQQERQIKKIKELASHQNSQLKKPLNSYQFYTPQKINGFFSDVLKVKRFDIPQSQAVGIKTIQPKERSFQRKHTFQKSHHFGTSFDKKHKNKIKHELSLMIIKKYPFSSLKIQQNSSQQFKNTKSLHISSIRMNEEQRQRKKYQINDQKEQKQKDLLYMQPWKIPDEGLYVDIDQFM